MSAYMRMLVCGIISNYRSLDAVYIYIGVGICLNVCKYVQYVIFF